MRKDTNLNRNYIDGSIENLICIYFFVLFKIVSARITTLIREQKNKNN